MILNIDSHPRDALAAIDSSGGRLTYGELCDFPLLLERHLRPRSLVFVLTENNVGGIAWIMGCIQAGMVPLILNAHTEISLLKSLYDTYRPNYIVKPVDTIAAVDDLELKCEVYGYHLLETGHPLCKMYNQLSHLLPTSGSTGSPKLVRHKYDNIEASAHNISTFFRLTTADRPLLVLPLYYTMGLSVVFSHLYVGATVLITNLNMTDRHFWAFMKEARATSFTGVPYSFEILNLMRFFRMDLPYLTVLTQGGGKMSRELNLKFAEYCRDTGRRWIATYGQSEGTARMAWLPPELAVDKCGSIGVAVPGGELSLIDSDGQLITEPGREGELCYRGRNVTMGYARSQEDLQRGDERGGFLRTGDLAYRDADGCYYITGRLGRFLKIYGNRIGLDECEQIVKSVVTCECACSGNDDRIIVYLTDGNQAEKAKDALIEAVRLPANVINIRSISALPKNEAGKILYAELNNE